MNAPGALVMLAEAEDTKGPGLFDCTYRTVLAHLHSWVKAPGQARRGDGLAPGIASGLREVELYAPHAARGSSRGGGQAPIVAPAEARIATASRASRRVPHVAEIGLVVSSSGNASRPTIS